MNDYGITPTELSLNRDRILTLPLSQDNLIINRVGVKI